MIWLMINFLEAIRIKEDVLKQKSRNNWLEAGNRNSNYFFNSIKGRRNRKIIITLTNLDGRQIKSIEETKEL